MVAQQFRPVAKATTDTMGNATFGPITPERWHYAAQGTISIDSGTAGTFTAFIGSTRWGTWSGSAPYGPITLEAQNQLIVTATGLSPNTEYTLQFVGIEDEVANIQPSSPYPSSVGATGLVGTDAIINLPALDVPAGGSQTFDWFPCINFAALRLAAELASGGPVTIECFWRNSDTTAEMGYRRFVIGETAPKLQVVIPHLGDQLRIEVSAAA